MSIIHALKREFGIVEGILVPGASPGVTDTTHQIQQTIADVYGPAIVAAVAASSAATALPGPQKAAAIAERVVGDIIAKGVPADPDTLRAVVLDVVQAAFRAARPTIASDILALARAFNLGPRLTAVAELAATAVVAAIDGLPMSPDAAPGGDNKVMMPRADEAAPVSPPSDPGAAPAA